MLRVERVNPPLGIAYTLGDNITLAPTIFGKLSGELLDMGRSKALDIKAVLL